MAKAFCLWLLVVQVVHFCLCLATCSAIHPINRGQIRGRKLLHSKPSPLDQFQRM